MLGRIGIFATYDPEGIVDDYIVFLLRDMRANLSRLVVVANGTLTEAGRRRLLAVADELHERPNTGFDVAAWQEGLVRHVGFDRLAEYEELILFNDSFFGPLYPFADMFEAMAPRNIDFWGLSEHGTTRGTGLCPYGCRPRYLQTYFLVFRNRLMTDPAFRAFWEELPVFRHFEELADRFAGVLTRHFADRGFAWAAFSDTADLDASPEKNLDHHTYNLHELVAHRRFPVIKRRSFRVPRADYLRHGDGSTLRDALDHARAHYAYDQRLIWQHLLRRLDPDTLKERLGLDIILPAEGPSPGPLPADRRIAVVAHLFYTELIEYGCRYLRDLPPEADLFVTTDTEEKRQEIARRLANRPGRPPTLLRVPARGRDWGALLAGALPHLGGYDYLCFVHDKLSPQKEYATVGATFRDMLWENTLASADYVRGVIAAFERQPELGLLVPPPPCHGTYFKSGMDYWTVCFEATAQLAARLGLGVRLDRSRQPVAVGSVFWCRTRALQPLLERAWTPEAFPPEPLPHDGTLNHALERILPFVAQSQGYLTGWVMTVRQASISLANADYMLNATRRALDGVPGLDFTTFLRFHRSLKRLRRLLRATGLHRVLPRAGQALDCARRHSPLLARRLYTRIRLGFRPGPRP